MRTRLLLATAAATLAFASPAAAAPFTDVGPLSGPGGQIDFGGATAGVPGEIDWNVAGGVPVPTLRGRLFMLDAGGAQARVRTVYYDDPVNHMLVTTQNGALRNGVAGGLATYPVNIGPFVAGSSHVHQELVVNGMVVDTATCSLGQAAC